MKVGIITYHFAQNYGSVLQCYALQEYLKRTGYNVRIINYVSDKQEKNNSFSDGLKAKIRNILFLTIKNKIQNKFEKFKEFREEYLCETKRISNLTELETLVRTEKFDFVISGSDQVFNPNINDFDMAFVLPFKTSAKKIAYAASLGNAGESELQQIKKSILDFNKISLRELEDEHTFENIIGISASVVCDPVFLLSREEWTTRISNIKTNINIHEKYLLCYFIHKKYMNKSIKLAKKIAKEKNLKIIFINAGYNLNSLNKETLVDCGPKEFLKLFYNAEYICTDSFHGTSFSIILNKNFICFDSKYNLKDNRRKNLLNELKLGSKFLYVENNNIKIENINFSKTNKIMKEFSNRSKKFLSFKK